MSYKVAQLKRNSFIALGAVVTLGALGASALPASAAEHRDSKTTNGYTVTSFAAVGNETNPDDITRLGDRIYVAFQNGVGPLGGASTTGGTSSTIQEYRLNGRAGKSWQIPGKIDGFAADNAQHRLLMTTNEDGNSHISTLTIGGEHALKTYTYSGLTHGGGADAISLVRGHIVISASAPTNASGAALYAVDLEGTMAKLTPEFADNASATAVNGPQAGQSVLLALTDPDSNTIVPRSSPRFQGEFMLTSQGDQQLIFASDLGTSKQTLHVLSVTQPLDDTAFATRPQQTLWVTDPTHNTIDAVTGPFIAGQALAAVTPDTGPAYLATVNLADGTLSPIKELSAIQPKGLLFSPTPTSPR